jgi:hypothetical protein
VWYDFRHAGLDYFRHKNERPRHSIRKSPGGCLRLSNIKQLVPVSGYHCKSLAVARTQCYRWFYQTNPSCSASPVVQK